jgi:hypothetical protein
MNEIGFKQMEYCSVFYNRVFEWQTHFYKAQIKAAQKMEALSKHAISNSNNTITLEDIYFGYQAFHQRELSALFKSRQYQQTTQELKSILPEVVKLQKEYIENLYFSLPIKMILHFQYPYFVTNKKIKLSSTDQSNTIEVAPQEKKRRRE